MKFIKRITSVLLVIAMLCTMSPVALAEDAPPDSNTESTDITEVSTVTTTETTEEPVTNNPEQKIEEPTTEPEPSADADEDTPTTIESIESAYDYLIAPISVDHAVYYVANSGSGGSDTKGDGTESKPYLTIAKAIETAMVNNAADLQIVLQSDISATLELVFDNADMPISFVSAAGTYTIQFTGTTSIGTESGFIKAVAGAQLSFDGVNLAGSTGAYDGRVLYVAEGAEVSLANMTVSAGRVNNVLTNEGGAGAFVADRGTLHIGTGTVFESNETVAGGGAVFVADGGTATISDDAEIRSNSAKLGGGVYADTQTHDYGGLNISDSVQITGNAATDNGSGMYVCAGANAIVQGDVQITGNDKGRDENNVYLPDGATLDIAGATIAANIGISCDPEHAYRLVSLPAGYDIQPTVNGDEKGWHDDCGTWDVRYMSYRGVPGLYLYYKTLDMSFKDINTLSGIQGMDINGEAVDFLADKDALPNVSVSGSVLTAADAVAKNTPEDDDLTITFTVDTDSYRIPTEDVVSVTSGGTNVAFTYTPDFANGTATITVDDAVVDTLTDTIAFNLTAEKYYDLTVRMEGPLYALTSSITELSQPALVITEQSKSGPNAHYKLTLDGQPMADVTVELYEEDTDAIGGTQITNADGVADFVGLQPTKSYYPIIKYEQAYRVISRDGVSLTLSTLEGQTLAADYIADTGAQTGTITYDASTGNASITGITADATITFAVDQAKDTISFIGNEGDATTAPATLSMASKEMPAGATTYGTLATASLTGYTFAGWYDAADDTGNLVETDTVYQTGVSPRILYAHWTANTATAYKIQHWIEYADGGVNARYEDGVTQTKQDNGVTYYLYETLDYADGVSDQVKDISGFDLQDMSDATITWWTRDGFTARYQQDCKVLADGSAAFSVYYDRNSYNISFDAAGAGTAVSQDTFDPQTVKFGALVGTLPQPKLPGYKFGGWYDGDVLVTATFVYNKTTDTALKAKWNAADDANWAIKIAVQDLAQNAGSEYYGADTYTEYKTVYKDNDGNLLLGTVDAEHEFLIADIAELTFEGFKLAGYADAYDQNDAGMTASTDKAKVYVTPTDVSTEKDGKYNPDFNGGIVWLYYDRKTATVSPDPNQPGGDDGNSGEIIYGGDFTGQLPPDPGKDGYDFDGWVDKDGDKITDDTPADKYVEEDGSVVVTPTWTARNYRLTYVPGDKATFVASDGGSGTANPIVAGGYMDSHEVTYDQAMGQMPAASKPGYTFDGWYLEDGTQITTDTVVTVENVVIHNDDFSYENTRPLYARYTPHTYTLVLHPGASSVTGDQGTVSPDRVTVTYDQEITGLPIPQLKGYTFVCWLLNIKDPATAVKNGDVWQTPYTNGAEIPAYAAWMPNDYKYTFDLNDDIGSTKGALVDTTIDHVEETFDSVYDGIFAVEAIRPGYDFNGWSLTENGDVLTADDLVALTEDTTVYAIWTPKKYDVKFIMKGAAMPDTFDAANAVRDDAADTWTIQVDFDSTYGTLPEPTKADCEYRGWLANAPHWAAIDNEVILDLPAYTDYQDAGITLKAVMEPWITFDPDGNKFDDGSTDPKKELQSEITELPNVTKPDYTFDGWTDKNNPDKVLTLDEVKNLEEPTILIPKFSANITFNANGGKMSDNDAETLTVGLSKITTLPSAYRSSYKLDGWYTAAEGGNQITLASLIAANTPATVYAHWTYAGGSGGGGGGGGGSTNYIITATADAGTQIDPAGKVSVSSGSSKTFKITADAGYMVSDVLVDGQSVGKSAEYTFNAVKANHTIEVKAASVLTGDHIAYVVGYPDGTVRPNANITRAEAAQIFYRLLSADARSEYNTTANSFADVPAGAWYTPAVATLANMGIIHGYSDGTFRPDAPITRAEFATIAARFDRLDGGDVNFADVSVSHWAYRYIASAAAKGWISGYPDGTFCPDANITRGETVKIVNAVLQRTADRDYLSTHPAQIKSFNDLSASHWAYYEIMEAAYTHNYIQINDKEVWDALEIK